MEALNGLADISFDPAGISLQDSDVLPVGDKQGVGNKLFGMLSAFPINISEPSVFDASASSLGSFAPPPSALYSGLRDVIFSGIALETTGSEDLGRT